MRASILYHYFHPDDVISARLFSDLAHHLVSEGWEVEALPCNRGCRDDSKVYPLSADWDGVEIRRVWRPPFSQRSSLGRAFNTVWMICAWVLILQRPFRKKPDVVIVGTDPPCSVAVSLLFKMSLWAPRFVCWIHDLYPDVAAASGMMREVGRPYRGISQMMARAYAKCDAIIDIGPYMRERVMKDGGDKAACETITPWAMHELQEPAEPDLDARRRLFGEAKLGLLYSGNYGRAHEAELFIKLASLLKDDGVAFAFAVRGNCVDELEKQISVAGIDAAIVPFDDDPSRHLAAADVHLVSLKPEWSGMVVPSKYFGALAVGRPVIYLGASQSDIGEWTRDFGTGWVLNEETLESVAADLRSAVINPQRIQNMGRNCFRIYHQHFARKLMLEKWESVLRDVASS